MYPALTNYDWLGDLSLKIGSNVYIMKKVMVNNSTNDKKKKKKKKAYNHLSHHITN